MVSEVVQQWTTIQTIRVAGLSTTDVWMTYRRIGGGEDELDVSGYLTGVIVLALRDRDLIAHAVNGLISTRGLLLDGAHYSTDDVAVASGFADTLRGLVLTPDGYRFDRPARTEPLGISGDGSTAATDEEPADDDESRRCNALFDTGLLDTGTERRFDRLTDEARIHFGVKSASIALITEDRQVIKSVAGPFGLNLPRATALCARTIEADRTFVIPDATASIEFHDHPLVVGAPNIRFYAGHPISSADGWRIGTLCLIDDHPRRFTEADERDLLLRATQVEVEIWLGTSDES